jgi:hypothetical protein
MVSHSSSHSSTRGQNERGGDGEAAQHFWKKKTKSALVWIESPCIWRKLVVKKQISELNNSEHHHGAYSIRSGALLRRYPTLIMSMNTC